MSDVRVLVWPADEGGTGFYRLRFPYRALAEAGADVVCTQAGPQIGWSEPWTGEEPPHHVNAICLAERPAADVVVIQRPGRKWWRQIIPMLHALGIGVVVDVDDRFDRIHPRNIAHPHFNKPETAWHSLHHIDACCRMADVVTASTPELADRYGYGKGVVLPNLVPYWYLALGATAHKLPRTLGWAGTMETHPDDLETTGGGVADALRGTDWHTHVVGTGEGVARALGVEAVSTTRGWVSFEMYPRHMARLEVGIVPLADNEFNRAKSCLKMAELAATGVPVVASPTPDNRRLHALGVGLLAATPNQWRRKVSSLIHNPEARAELAGKGQEVMARNTYEAHCGRWWDAWASGVMIRPRQGAEI